MFYTHQTVHKSPPPLRPVENILCENFNLFHLLKSCSTQYESVVFLYLRAILIFLQNFKKIRVENCNK